MTKGHVATVLCSITELDIMRIFITLLLVAGSFQSYGCDCDWGGNFLESGAFGEFVFKGRIVERTFHLANGEEFKDSESAYRSMIENELDHFYGIGESITVEVIDIIKGSKQLKTIRIFDSDGADCRANISNFTIGSAYIFSAYKPNRQEPKLPNETSKDFAIGGCSENWLEYNSETDEVSGKIKGKSINRARRTWKYSKLLNEIT